MSDIFSVGQILRRMYQTPPAADDLDALAGQADAAVAAVAAQPGLHPLMRATLDRLYGENNAAKLDAAVAAAQAADEPHGAGHELIYEYDPVEQARFEAACAREEAGE